MNLQDRKKRVIARGEQSNHSHVLVGDASYENEIITTNESPDYSEYMDRYNDFISKTNKEKLNEKYPEFQQSVSHLNVAKVCHIKETSWLEGQEIWTGEHFDIPLPAKTKMKYIQQGEYDPYDGFREVYD